MAVWGSRKQDASRAVSPVWHVCINGSNARKKVPKGYVPMVLVDGDDEEQGQRILVHVQMLREPCMAALLEMSDQQYGHGQRGVLRIPCSVTHFEQMISGSMFKAAR